MASPGLFQQGRFADVIGDERQQGPKGVRSTWGGGGGL
jgi:hypothetical protein